MAQRIQNQSTEHSSNSMLERDRYSEATSDMATHIGEKILMVLRHPENQARVQSVMDPIISHIIQRVFPYILFTAILFLILFIFSIGTFWLVMKGATQTVAPVAKSALQSLAVTADLLSAPGAL